MVATSGLVRAGGKGSPPIGRPIANTEVYVMDESLNPVPVGVYGELCIGGEGLARGYLGRAELTGERFIPHPESAERGGRLYRTGDVCRFRSDGQVEFVGRTDYQIKIRGYRIELGEIEGLLGEHPGVQAAIVAREEGSVKPLTAYVVLEPSKEGEPAVGEAALKRYLGSRLPEYMLPKSFVVLKAFPLTSSGKIDRKALPAPHRFRRDPEQSFVAPRTAAEEALARIWSEVLGVEELGIHDNFFELGGDSILSIQVVAKAHQRNMHITPRQVFEHQTIAELATAVGVAEKVEAEQGLVVGSVPLTPIQHWFFDQNLSDGNHFNQSVFFKLHEPVDARCLRSAVKQVLSHHDALRIRFERDAPTWQQHGIGAEAAVDRRIFLHFDFTRVQPSMWKSAIERTSCDLQASLNLFEGPLLRVALYELGDRSSRLLIVIHHLVVNAVSLRILLEDLHLAYQQLQRGRSVQLLPKTTSFKAWSERLREYAVSEAMASEAPFWLHMVGGESVPLPLDRVNGVNTVDSTRTLTASLSTDETRAVLQEVPERVYRTEINDVLLTALVRSFMPWTGRACLEVNLEGHGREDLFDDADLTRTVGWFTTMFPVRLDLKGIADPGASLRAIKEQLRRLPRRGIGYGILKYLRGERELAERLDALRAQVRFNYLGQFGQGAAEVLPYGPAPELAGPPQSPRGLRTHPLSITAAVSEGQLRVHFKYSENLHHQSTIERLVESFASSLRALVKSGESPEAGGYSASDFVDFDWNAGDVEHIDAAIQRSLDDG